MKNLEANKIKKKGNRTLSMVMIPLFTALTAVGSQISIPFGTVPVTLQMLFVFLAGYILKPFEAFMSMMLYLVLGGIGIPVFANLSAGFSYLVGPTSGYLWAFPLAAYIISSSKNRNLFASGLTGLCIVYAFGWLVLGASIQSFQKAFVVGILPFIAFDIGKLFVAIYAYKKICKSLDRWEEA
ncbi:MAG TPA: biotin transporter BioY [Fervidobacterium sp.]|nr:biotin transporter BioY [Fervidobacterium sp.]HPT54047.1 biotin transporter BioY [Fervidobacterium sp.]HPZ17401.1 biotin transporter BioY [Fervidobacterium sp.]HQE48501.1 biotin transporter BioY [Fervidobacterium sp.]HUM42276.1 biotin transporter BioY [Fervidobacterium sp.]